MTTEKGNITTDLKEVIHTLTEDYPVKFLVEKDGVEISLYIGSLIVVLKKNVTWEAKS